MNGLIESIIPSESRPGFRFTFSYSAIPELKGQDLLPMASKEDLYTLGFSS